MTYEQWEAGVPRAVTADALWKVQAYRLSLFLADLGAADGQNLLKHDLGRVYADQLVRATGNISSSIAEGYSRGTSKVRCLYYEYALGSARESRDWYFKAREGLGPRVYDHRIELCAQLVKLLLAMIVKERRTGRRLGPSDRGFD